MSLLAASLKVVAVTALGAAALVLIIIALPFAFAWGLWKGICA